MKILGPSKYAAYKDGGIKLQNLIGVKRSETWGKMFYERSLRELGIDWKKYAGVSIPPASSGVPASDLLAIAKPAAEELGKIVGTPQAWSGKISWVSVKNAPDYRGCYNPDNSIEIRTDARSNTIIHELLHSHSVGLNLKDYRLYRGWEEGVLEKLQRLVGPEVLEKNRADANCRNVCL
jgi:hypothetical protein